MRRPLASRVDSIPSLPMVVCVLALGLVVALPAPSLAMPLKAGAGFGYYSGPNDQSTKSVQALIVADLGSVGLSLVGTRFDDNLIGKGMSFTAGLGLSVMPMAVVRVYGSRYLADQDYRAWRIKAGPEVHLPGGQSLGLYYSHYDDHSDVTSNAMIAELATPLVEHLTGRAMAAYATATGSSPSGQGSLGLTWSLIHGVDLLGDVGIAKSSTTAAQSFPSHKRSLHLPLIGGEPEPGTTVEHTSTRATATAELGVRILLP